MNTKIKKVEIGIFKAVDSGKEYIVYEMQEIYIAEAMSSTDEELLGIKYLVTHTGLSVVKEDPGVFKIGKTQEIIRKI